jgi:hypothetical protein
MTSLAITEQMWDNRGTSGKHAHKIQNNNKLNNKQQQQQQQNRKLK